MSRTAILDGNYKVINIVNSSAAPSVTTEIALDDADITTSVGTQMPLYDANAVILRSKASTALGLNNTFLAIGSPTNTQVLAQVQLLTKECDGLIRLVINQLDSTAGT